MTMVMLADYYASQHFSHININIILKCELYHLIIRLLTNIQNWMNPAGSAAFSSGPSFWGYRCHF